MPVESPVIWTHEPRDLEVVTLTAAEMIVVAQLHAIAQKYQWSLGCPKCQMAFSAKNGSSDSVWSFSCKCREFKGVVGSSRPA